MIYTLSGGGTGGTLVVTGVAGDTVTATKDGKSYKRTFNASGIATFKGLKTGTWALTMTDGSQSVTQNVTINADYSLTMAYFSALITTTWPEGSTCSCTDGTSTLYAPDTSGSYTFNVPNKGTWTVTATNGSKTASKSVSITAEGQTEKVTLVYRLYLYNSGDECTSVTGGWNYTKLQGNQFWTNVPFVNSDEVLTAKLSTAAALSTYCMTGPTNKIDVTAYSKLVFVVTELSRNSVTEQQSLGKAGIGTQASYSTSQAISDIFNSTFSSSVACSVGTLKLDISNITGEQYIQIGCISYNISVSSVYLEA